MHKVKLLKHTESPEAIVAAAARLCYSDDGAEEILDKHKDNAKFIAMLRSIGHYSPFEHISFTYSIEGVSRAFLAQVTRHRLASYSVRSQRYVAESNFGYITPPAITALGADAVLEYESQMATIGEWYNKWRERLGGDKIANEDARFVLPNACETKMIMTANARELFHFFGLRCCERAQWEIRAVAWDMLKEAYRVAPNIFAGCGPGCVSKGVCPEGKMSCGKVVQMRERASKLNIQ